jgi:hypothetical protein
MTMAEAKPGDVLVDRDGALWLVGKRRARVMNDPTEGADGDAPFESSPVLLAKAEQFGPFARMVPEPTP